MGRGTLQWRVAVSNEWAGRVAFALDGRIVTGGSDGLLRVVDPMHGAVLGQLAFDDQIVALAVSSLNEAAVIVGAPNGTVMRIRLDTLSNENATMQIVEGAATVRGQLVYSPDGSLLALNRGSSATSEAILELWQTSNDTLVQTIALGNIYGINALAFSPDGKFIATGAHATRPITLWPVNIEGATTDRQPQELGIAGSTSPSTRLTFVADGTQLFATDENVVTTLYSLVPTHRLRTLTGHRGNVWDVDMSPNGRWAMTAGDDHSVRLWDWQTGAQLYQLAQEPDAVHSVSYSPDGYNILVGSDDGVARLYDTEGALRQTFQGHTEPIINAIFRPDNLAIATSSVDGSVRAWNRMNGEQEWSIRNLPVGVGALAYTPDGSLLAGSAGSGPDTTIHLWNAATGAEVRQLFGHDYPVVELDFSPDGTLLASASFDRTIKLWNVVTGQAVATLRGHTEILTGLDFSGDGTMLASVGEDRTLRLWDVASASLLTTIEMPVMPTSVAFSLSRQALLTTHTDGTLRTWLTDLSDDDIESKLLVAAARVPAPPLNLPSKNAERTPLTHS